MPEGSEFNFRILFVTIIQQAMFLCRLAARIDYFSRACDECVANSPRGIASRDNFPSTA
jgi:hypothetical protein